MDDDCIYWDPTLSRRGGDTPAFPASALPAVAGHPVQSLFFSVDPWAICSVMFYAACIMLVWSGLVFFAIKVVAESFAPRPLYVCKVETVKAASTWFNLASTGGANNSAPTAYDISFDQRLPNEHGLLFVTLPNTGPICLTLKSSDQSDARPGETSSFVIDWSSVPLGAQVGPDDLVARDACVYFGRTESPRTAVDPADKDYD